MSAFAGALTQAAPLLENRPLKIGVIGAGKVGGALAQHWVKARSLSRSAWSTMPDSSP